MKQKEFFIIFKGLSVAKNCLRPESVLLTLSWRGPLSYRNQFIDLLSKSMDWFLYDNSPRHERVKDTRKTIDDLNKKQKSIWSNVFWSAKVSHYPDNVYLFKFNNKNTKKRREIRSKLTIKIPERRRYGVFIVNFERILHLF